jgi:hypothetical protein
MTDLQKFQRVCRVFLARLLTVHGEDAPDVLRRITDELEWLEAAGSLHHCVRQSAASANAVHIGHRACHVGLGFSCSRGVS